MDKDRDMQILDANMGANTWVNKKPVVKTKAVPIKKTAATNPRGANGNQRKSFDRVDNEGNIIIAPQDRANNPKRLPNTARHAKPGEPVYGEYPATPTGPANGGKHGKSWNGKD
jgi:hypothetical protein